MDILSFLRPSCAHVPSCDLKLKRWHFSCCHTCRKRRDLLRHGAKTAKLYITNDPAAGYLDLMYVYDPQGTIIIPKESDVWTVFVDTERPHKKLKDAILKRLKAIHEALAN